jgi:hypothetical protein
MQNQNYFEILHTARTNGTLAETLSNLVNEATQKSGKTADQVVANLAVAVESQKSTIRSIISGSNKNPPDKRLVVFSNSFSSII